MNDLYNHNLKAIEQALRVQDARVGDLAQELAKAQAQVSALTEKCSALEAKVLQALAQSAYAGSSEG